MASMKTADAAQRKSGLQEAMLAVVERQSAQVLTVIASKEKNKSFIILQKMTKKV